MKLIDFQQTISDFLLHVRTEKNLSDNTYRAYTSDLKQLELFWQTEENNINTTLSLQTIAQRFHTHLKKQKAGKSTVARKLSCLNSYERYIAQKVGLNLELKLVRPHVPIKQPKYLSKKDITFLLDTLPTESLPTPQPYRDKAILELLYATGIRCSELITITLKDINLKERSIVIRSKRKKARTVFFSATAKEKIILYLENERKPSKSNRESIFLNYRSQPLTTRSIQRICNMFGKFLKTKQSVTPQLLRHSFAIHLIKQGAHIKTVEKLLGYTTSVSIEKYLK